MGILAMEKRNDFSRELRYYQNRLQRGPFTPLLECKDNSSHEAKADIIA